MKHQHPSFTSGKPATAKRLLCLLLAFLLVLTTLTSCKKKEEETPQETAPAEEEKPLTVDVGFGKYDQNPRADVIRTVSSDDRVRNLDYTVSDEKLEQLIDKLDAALQSKEVKELLGLDLAETLKKLPEKLYTNDIVNAAIQALYPIAELEFSKAWAGKPSDVNLEGVDTGVSVAPKADVTADLYLCDIEPGLAASEFYLFPSTLADHLPAQFESVANQLKQVQTKSVYNPETEELVSPWKDPLLLDEEGKLNLDWGVKDRETFIQAMSAALYGVQPLLLAMLSNVYCYNPGNIGYGVGKAAVLGGVLKLDMDITEIELVLISTANPGYNNGLAPIFEALGVKVPNGNEFRNMRDAIEKGVVEPLEEVLDKVAKAPIRTVLSLLPHLAFALDEGIVLPLLSLIKTDVSYTTNAYYTVQLAGDGELMDAFTMETPVTVNVGTMFDLNDLGIDLSSLNGVIQSVAKMLEIELPEIDGTALANLGKVVWRDTIREQRLYTEGEAGKAAYVEANCADVLLFLLDWVGQALQNKDFLPSLLEKLNVEAELPDLVYEIIDNVAFLGSDVTAVLAELMFPQEYTKPDYVPRKLTPASKNVVAPLYTDYWTKEKAQYMAKNLAPLADSALEMLKPEIAGIKATSLSDLVNGLLAQICRADILNDLAKTLSDTLGGLGLPEQIFGVAKDLLGIDLTYWDSYKATFKDGDRAGFIAAVADLLSPAEPLLKYLLAGENITLSLTAEDGSPIDLITLQGYDGYARALVPVLEILGAKNLPAPGMLSQDFRGSFTRVLNSLFGIFDTLASDPLSQLATLLPNLLSFLKTGGLSKAVNALLYPVDLLLDIIRPIYNVDLDALIDFDIRFTSTDVVALLCKTLKPTLDDALGVSIPLNFTTNSLYNKLAFGKVQTYNSVNGDACQRIVPNDDDKADILTVIYNWLVKTLLDGKTGEALLKMAGEKLSLDASIVSRISALLPKLRQAEKDYPGSARALIFWLFFAADAGLGSISENGGNIDALALIQSLLNIKDPEKRAFAQSELRKDIRNEGFASVFRSLLQGLLGR